MITAAELPKYHEKACRDMVRRGIAGCFMYVVLWGAIVGVGDFFMHYPYLAWAGMISLGVFAVIRTWLSIDFSRFYQRDPKSWEYGYGLGILGSALSWGVLTSIIFYKFLPDGPMAYLIGLVTSGFAQGGTVSLLGHIRLQRAHQTLLLLPTSLICLYVGEALPITMGVFLILGWFYLLSVGREMNQQYYSALKSNETLEQLATTDKLTGISNRRYFDELASPTFQHAIRARHQVTVIMLDVDFFKLYNDTYGHAKGDECLKSLAQVLSNTFRRSTDLIARYGGEEFSALVIDLPYDDVVHVMQTLLNDISGLSIPHAGSFAAPHVTVSIGSITLKPPSSVTFHEIIEHADKLLYRAKSEGRNRAILVNADSNSENILQPQ